MTNTHYGTGWLRVGGLFVESGEDTTRDLLEAAGELETLDQVDRLTTIVEQKSEAGQLTPAQAVAALGAVERAYSRLQEAEHKAAPPRRPGTGAWEGPALPAPPRGPGWEIGPAIPGVRLVR